MGTGDDIGIGLLGPVVGMLDGVPLDFGPPKQKLVLAALALAANRTLPIDRLVDLTWPDAPPPSARTAIHGRISRLRAVFAAADGDRHGIALVSQGSGYSLRLDPELVDAHRFTELLGRARAATSDELAASLYERALGLWRGRALDGVATDDVRRVLCGNLEEARLLAVDEQADVLLRLGRHHDLVDRLTGHLTANPLRERTAVQLALALYRCGQAGNALAVCRRTKKVLDDELGIDPGPELSALEVSILRNDESLAPPARQRMTAAGAVPAHLPAATAGFTGRAAESRRLTELLADGSTALPVAVVSGPAGVGKTTLAVHCGHAVAARYPDGQLYADLRGYDLGEPVRPVDALAGFLRALGMPPTQVPTDLADAVPAYRSLLAGRRVLVVLDNARDAEQVRPLLPGAGTCAVVVTSRDELRGLTVFEGATPLRLDVLSPAESLTLLGRTVGTARIDTDPAASAELAALCDHLPLALRIAGAHLAGRPEQPVAEYTRALAEGNRLGELAIPEDPRAAVRAAFDLSYRALAPEDRLLFRRLGLVPGPDVTAEAAATVAGCPVPAAAAGLARLATAHLVRPLGADRYGWHDLVRLYAAGQAAPGEDAVLDDLYAFYLRHMDAAARVLYPHRVRLPVAEEAEFADAAAALAWLDAEFANLAAAVHHAAATGRHRTACLLADALRGYFIGRGLTPQWQAMAEVALASAREENDPALVVVAHLNFGELHLAVAGYQDAVRHYDEARVMAVRADWPDAESTALGNKGAVLREAGDLRRAADSFTAALEINERIGNERKQVLDLMNLGVVQALLGRLATASDLFKRAAELGAGTPVIDAMVRQCLGNTERHLGRFASAIGHLTAALAEFREHGHLTGAASVLDSLAGTHAEAGDVAQAASLAEEALQLARQTDSRRVESAVLNTLGQVQTDPAVAAARYEEALAVATEVGHVAARIEALVGLSGVGASAGRAQEALALARETDHRMLEGRALTALAVAAFAAGDSAAVRLAEEALAIHEETGYHLGITQTKRLLTGGRRL